MAYEYQKAKQVELGSCQSTQVSPAFTLLQVWSFLTMSASEWSGVPQVGFPCASIIFESINVGSLGGLH